MAILAEFLCDETVPHYLVGVRQQIYIVVFVEFLKFAESLDRYADQELLECFVDLVVGHSRRHQLVYFPMKLLRADFSLFQLQERPGLTVVSEHLVHIAHAQCLKSLDRVHSLYFHYDPSQVKHQILYHLLVIFFDDARSRSTPAGVWNMRNPNSFTTA